MNNLAIKVEGLSKKYRLGMSLSQNDTLRDWIMSRVNASIKFIRNGSVHQKKRKTHGVETTDQTLWALRDISFEVKHGNVLGIIGRNGAGKSTLLKILSRITEPSYGCAFIKGRVGSLLEVGTGFHPELTGLENIYLNGAILGMTRHEIKRKLNEIIEFAEIEKFLDTPVKRYSSGMYVRLAFAVAAHLEPEILLVDEVLAVGDAAFQKKCLGKMGEVVQEGRTILFVSHNMQAVQKLCPNSILLHDGCLISYGSTPTVVAQYLSSNSIIASPNTWIDVSKIKREGIGDPRFLRFRYCSSAKEIGYYPYCNGPIDVFVEIRADIARTIGSISITLYDQNGTKLVNADSSYLGRTIKLIQGLNILRFKIESLYLTPGIYTIGLWMANQSGEIFDHIQNSGKIEVMNRGDEWYGTTGDGLVSCKFSIDT